MQTLLGIDIVFHYEIQKLFDEVTKRTSMMGKMRVNKDLPDAFDRLSLTEGEDFMFKPFLEEATTEAFDWMKAFAHDVRDAVTIVNDITPIAISANDGVTVYYNGQEIKNSPFKLNDDIRPYKDSQYETELRIRNNSDYPIKVKIGLSAKYTATNLLGQDVRYINQSNEYTIYAQEKIDEVLFTPTFKLGGATQVGSIEIPPEELLDEPVYITVDSIETELISDVFLMKGTLIDYTNQQGATYRYLLTKDETINTMCLDDAIKIDLQPNSILYRLHQPEWWDDNMLRSADNAIFEYIVNYIMWKWLLLVYPMEAQVYEALVEKAGKNIQTRLNGENKPLQRKSSWF